MTTILVVDDREDMRLEMKSQLEKRGFAVELAANGKESITVCQRGIVNAIIMDLNMPEMDGCEAAEALKREAQTQHIPIILCTAHPLDVDLARANQAGCDAFWEKPISIDSLIEMLAKLPPPPEVPPTSHVLTDNRPHTAI